MDTILIEGLEFYGFHGVPDAEQAVGHRYRIDVRLEVDTHLAGKTDDVADTVDYSAVAACIVRIGVEEQFRLIEALAQQIANDVLERFAPVHSVKLQLRKLLPPMNVIAAAVGVEITRSRHFE